MGAIIAIIFCLIILSPISSVGVATVIMLSGIGSGAANFGIVATGMWAYALLATKQIHLGTST